MRVNGKDHRTIWPDEARRGVRIIDQTRLPHEFRTVALDRWQAVETAIRTMQVRGAPLIGVAGAYGVALAAQADPGDGAIADACRALATARPTAVNLRWAVARMERLLAPLPAPERAESAWREAAAIADEDVAINRAIGVHGQTLIEAVWHRTHRPVQVLTHCNAGWLATVDWGTALAPVYAAHDAGIPLHVWVDETRPRNQGASLTAWELQQHGIPFTVIADNAGGHLMQHGRVDLAIVGCDRVSAHGDVCNKIGTYLKALAAHDNGVPFYVALPSPTIDWTIADGVREIPIEERGADEVTHITGRDADGALRRVLLTPEGAPAANYGFDVTPARLVTALVTERGIIPATAQDIRAALGADVAALEQRMVCRSPVHSA
ncbi:methylthioribose-1-phosphate isomerase [Burkholderiales bacterium GJ-E10]|nr:methylthioribose-1-phosphate isomerase [Burkholderiales bacterium GJ-E10]